MSAHEPTEPWSDDSAAGTTEAGTRTEVDTASVGLLTIDTRSEAIASCNEAFAGLVGRRAGDVQGCLFSDFVDDGVKSVIAAVVEGIRAGFISCVDGTVCLFGRAGSVGVDCWIRAIGTDPPHSIALAGVLPATAPTAPDIDPSDMGFRPTHMDPSRVVLATLDEEGRIVDVARAGAGGLGLPEPDASTVLPRLRELAHPDDATVLDELLGRHSSGGVPDTFTLRLRGARREWVSTRVTVSPLSGPVTPRFGLVVWPIHPEELASEAARLACLEDQLDRIRQVVQDQDQEIAPGSVDLGELTLRQQEIVARLLGGHRVDAIARALYVSPSTVRNHLSSIFEKLGVASQSELVELLRGYEFGARVGTGLGHK